MLLICCLYLQHYTIIWFCITVFWRMMPNILSLVFQDKKGTANGNSNDQKKKCIAQNHRVIEARKDLRDQVQQIIEKLSDWHTFDTELMPFCTESHADSWVHNIPLFPRASNYKHLSFSTPTLILFNKRNPTTKQLCGNNWAIMSKLHWEASVYILQLS